MIHCAVAGLGHKVDNRINARPLLIDAPMAAMARILSGREGFREKIAPAPGMTCGCVTYGCVDNSDRWSENGPQRLAEVGHCQAYVRLKPDTAYGEIRRTLKLGARRP